MSALPLSSRWPDRGKKRIDVTALPVGLRHACTSIARDVVGDAAHLLAQVDVEVLRHMHVRAALVVVELRAVERGRLVALVRRLLPPRERLRRRRHDRAALDHVFDAAALLVILDLVLLFVVGALLDLFVFGLPPEPGPRPRRMRRRRPATVASPLLSRVLRMRAFSSLICRPESVVRSGPPYAFSTARCLLRKVYSLSMISCAVPVSTPFLLTPSCDDSSRNGFAGPSAVCARSRVRVLDYRVVGFGLGSDDERILWRHVRGYSSRSAMFLSLARRLDFRVLAALGVRRVGKCAWRKVFRGQNFGPGCSHHPKITCDLLDIFEERASRKLHGAPEKRLCTLSRA